MKEGFYRANYIPFEEKNLHQFKGKTLADVIEYLEGNEKDIQNFNGAESWEEYLNRQDQNIFDGFLDLLRSKGVRVSTPEWLQFIQVIGKKTNANELKKLVYSNELLNKVRLFAQTTLVKNKADEAAFHEAFNEYFELAAKVYKHELDLEDKKDVVVPEEKDSFDSEVTPEIKDKLNIQDVAEDLDVPLNEEHGDDENIHGGKKDQHNDILKKQDLSKKGGGNKKDGPNGESKEKQEKEKDKESEGNEGRGDKGNAAEGQGDQGDAGEGKGDKGGAGEGQGDKGEAGEGQGDKGDAGKGKGDKGDPSGMGKGSFEQELTEEDDGSSMIPENTRNVQQQMTENGYLIGGGKGKSINAERIYQDNNIQYIINEGEKKDRQAVEIREKKVNRFDRRKRYEIRPDRASMAEVIRNIRRVIMDVSEVKTKHVNLRRTVNNFARRDFRFEFERERDKQPEIVLFIDVGGPVDEWSPLVKEVAEAMADGLTKLEIYLFHNNLYGYVWKPDPRNLLASSYASANSLIDIKAIVKRRKKVIIYGDADMSDSEFKYDQWEPMNNKERVSKYSMSGVECLNYIKRKADNVVWINPIFEKEWKRDDDSGTIGAVGKIIKMHDLTIGGVEDAVKDLMKK